MIEQTLSQLRQLKLTGMAGALQTQQEQPGIKILKKKKLAWKDQMEKILMQNR